VDYYIPLIDEEIPLAWALAKKLPRLRIIAPRLEFVNLCRDKYRLMKRLEREGLSRVQTGKADQRASPRRFPLFVKPRTSRGSRGTYRVETPEELRAAVVLGRLHPKDVLIQEFLNGTEYTVSVVVDNANRLLAIVPKRVIVKKGITLHAVTEKNSLITDVCKRMVEKLRPCGPCNVQLKIDRGTVKIFEVNPRFSTTSVLTCEAGVDEFSLCIESFNKKGVRYSNSFKEGLFLYRRWENCFYET
jgi:carbamoyl-phosphate synthase large subunit